MLVLGRRQNEKLVFPHLGITVEILRIAGNTVKVGIEAPPEIRVLREELARQEDFDEGQPPAVSPHRLRNRLHTAMLALRVVEKSLQAGAGDVEGALERAIEMIAQLDQELAAAFQAPLPHALAAASPPKRALLVEDDANECELLAGYLRLSGYDVDTAKDGEEALDYLSSHDRPDVVLLDMMMPRCDGRQTITAIRSSPKFQGLRVFAVSGSTPAESGVSAGPGGVDRWFPKPLDPERLVRELERDLAIA